MNYIDYTGKLNTHEEYVAILDKLKSITSYIEIVIIDEKENNEITNNFSKDIIEKKKVSKWWGTETEDINNLYKIKSSNELFKFLKKYETFCKYIIKESKVDQQINTDFGYDDIAFYDGNNKLLLYTTTHECFITIIEDLI